MSRFNVKVVREAGIDPISGEHTSRDEETFEVEAEDEHKAYISSHFTSKLVFKGQTKTTYINGQEYRDPRY